MDGRNSVHPTTDHTNEKRFSFVVGLWCFLFSLPEEEKRKGRSSTDVRSTPAPGQTFPRRKGRNVVHRSWSGAGMSRHQAPASDVRLTPRPEKRERSHIRSSLLLQGPGASVFSVLLPVGHMNHLPADRRQQHFPRNRMKKSLAADRIDRCGDFFLSHCSLANDPGSCRQMSRSLGKKLRSGSRRTWPRSRFLPGRDVRTGANRRLFPLAQCFRQTRNMCQGTIVTSPAANYLPHAAERSLQSWNSIHHQLWIDRLCAITVECCSRKK